MRQTHNGKTYQTPDTELLPLADTGLLEIDIDSLPPLLPASTDPLEIDLIDLPEIHEISTQEYIYFQESFANWDPMRLLIDNTDLPKIDIDPLPPLLLIDTELPELYDIGFQEGLGLANTDLVEGLTKTRHKPM